MSDNMHPHPQEAAPNAPRLFDTEKIYTRCPPGYVFDHQRGEGYIKRKAPAPVEVLEVPYDGNRWRNDWVTPRIVSVPIVVPGGPLKAPIFIANHAGAKHAATQWPATGAILNLCGDRLDFSCAYNDLAIPDCPTDAAAELEKGWFAKTADLIHTLREKNDWVIVNCMGGINRSSAVIINYLMVHGNATISEAMVLLREAKLVSAKRLRLKNRYQSFDPTSKTVDQFSWPTLQGGASEVFMASLKATNASLAQPRGVKRRAEQ